MLDFKTTFKQTINNYQYLNFSKRYLSDTVISDPYFGEVSIPPVRGQLNTDINKLVSFVLPGNIENHDEFDILLDGTKITDTDYSFEWLEDRVYIYKDNMDELETFDPTIRIIQLNQPNFVSRNPFNESSIKLSRTSFSYYLKGDFIDVTAGKNTVDKNYIFSNFLVGINNDQIIKDEVIRVNDHEIELTETQKNYDEIYVLVSESEAYYTETLKNYFNHLESFPQKKFSTKIKDVVQAGLENYTSQELEDIISSEDPDLYNHVQRKRITQKNKSLDLKDVKVITESKRGLPGTDKLDLNLPKFYISIYNPDKFDIEIYYDNLLYFGDRTIYWEKDYTHIYIGTKRLVDFDDTINYTNEILTALEEKTLEGTLSISLKNKSYVYENYILPDPKFKGYFYLPKNFSDLYGVKIYKDGELFDKDDYNIVNKGDDQLLMFDERYDEGTVFTLTGYTEEIEFSRHKVDYQSLLEYKNLNSQCDIYYKGYNINNLTDGVTINHSYINVDTNDASKGEFTITSTNLFSDIELIDRSGYKDKLFEKFEPVYTQDHKEFFEEKQYSEIPEYEKQLHEFFTLILESGQLGTDVFNPTEVNESLISKFSLLFDENNVLKIDTNANLELPREIDVCNIERHLYDLETHFLHQYKNDEVTTVPEFIKNQGGRTRVPRDIYDFLQSKYQKLD